MLWYQTWTVMYWHILVHVGTSKYKLVSSCTWRQQFYESMYLDRKRVDAELYPGTWWNTSRCILWYHPANSDTIIRYYIILIFYTHYFTNFYYFLLYFIICFSVSVLLFPIIRFSPKWLLFSVFFPCYFFFYCINYLYCC